MTLRHAIKVAVGRAGNRMLPHLARDIDRGENKTRGGWIKQAMIEARIVDARARRDDEALAGTFRTYWTSAKAHDYHTSWIDERSALFRNHHAEVLEQAVSLVGDRPEMRHYIEMGCGDGTLMRMFAARLPRFESFTGVDLNPEVIAKNQAEPQPDGRIGYVNADALDHVTGAARPGTMLFSYNGKLEYFSPGQFDRLMAALAARGPAVVALVEPVAPEHDLDRMPDSFAFGHEGTFSHNHRDRLSRAGYRIHFRKVLTAERIRWIMLVASTGLSQVEDREVERAAPACARAGT